MLEDPDRECSVRLDSESTMRGDYLLATELFREHGLEPCINLGGGFDFRKTAEFEKLRGNTGWDPRKQRYMYGQYLVEPHVPLPTRGDVGAVYKLSQTGSRPTMKFSDNPAKSSLPGRPIVFRGVGPHSDLTVIGQEGEEPSPGTVPVWPSGPESAPTRVVNSPATRALIDRCIKERTANVQNALSLEFSHARD